MGVEPGSGEARSTAGFRPRLRDFNRRNQEPASWAFKLAVPVVHGLLNLLIRRDWDGGSALPRTGPAIIAANHNSSLDPLVVGEYLAWHGRWPHFLAKAEMFEWPVIGRLMPLVGQIPVRRGGQSALDSLAAAAEALGRGEVVVIYPEGTFTHDPDEWPMAPYTGAVRLAMRTGAPLIPLSQWGCNRLWPPHESRPANWFARPRVTLRCGQPMDLSGLDGHAPAAIRAASMRLMDAITAMLEEIRQEPAPQGRWLPRRRARVPRNEAIA